MILIVTHSRDLSADFVIRHLHAGRHLYIRLNSDLLGTPACFFGYATEPELHIGDRIIRASEISAIWARRFAIPTVLGSVGREYADFTRRELATVMDAFLEGSNDAFCINPSPVDRLAGNRLLQAQRAREVGFLIPDSLVTQDREIARGFLQEHKRVITKAISFGRLSTEDGNEQVAFSSSVTFDSNLDGLACCPSLFQQMVPNAFDWRVTTVGERVFAAKLSHTDSGGRVDWRQKEDAATKFVQADLPADVTTLLRRLCEKSQIIYGAHDLVETPSGDFYFLETNPAGQWAWLELSLGMPIGQAIASELAAHRTNAGSR